MEDEGNHQEVYAVQLKTNIFLSESYSYLHDSISFNGSHVT